MLSHAGMLWHTKASHCSSCSSLRSIVVNTSGSVHGPYTKCRHMACSCAESHHTVNTVYESRHSRDAWRHDIKLGKLNTVSCNSDELEVLLQVWQGHRHILAEE